MPRTLGRSAAEPHRPARTKAQADTGYIGDIGDHKDRRNGIAVTPMLCFTFDLCRLTFALCRCSGRAEWLRALRFSRAFRVPPFTFAISATLLLSLADC